MTAAWKCFRAVTKGGGTNFLKSRNFNYRISVPDISQRGFNMCKNKKAISRSRSRYAHGARPDQQAGGVGILAFFAAWEVGGGVGGGAGGGWRWTCSVHQTSIKVSLWVMRAGSQGDQTAAPACQQARLMALRTGQEGTEGKHKGGRRNSEGGGAGRLNNTRLISIPPSLAG